MYHDFFKPGRQCLDAGVWDLNAMLIRRDTQTEANVEIFTSSVGYKEDGAVRVVKRTKVQCRDIHVQCWIQRGWSCEGGKEDEGPTTPMYTALSLFERF